MRVEQPSTSISDDLIEAICSVLVQKGLVHPGKLEALMPPDFPYNRWFKRFGVLVHYAPDVVQSKLVRFEFVTPDDLHIEQFEVSLSQVVKLKQKYVQHRFASLQGALDKMREDRARKAPANLTPEWTSEGPIKPKNGKDFVGLDHAGTDSRH